VKGALDAAGFEALPEADLLARLGGGPAARQLLAFAARRGEAVKLRDDLWLGGAAWDRMVRTLRDEAAAGRATIDVGTFKELFGISRKYAIPLLEKLDAEAVTQRIGNERRVRPSR